MTQATAAQTAKTAAETAQASAEAAEALAVTAKEDAESASTTATQQAVLATAAQNAASGSEAQALIYSNNAATSESNAAGSASSAASTVNGLTARLDNVNGSSDSASQISVEQAYSAQATTNGDLEAQYSVKIDNNGAVSGFGLSSVSVNGTPESAFIVNADKFAIIDPATEDEVTSNNPDATSIPFGVSSGNVYIKAAFIEDASITSAKINDLSADLVNAVDINAGSIGTGTLDAARIDVGSLSGDKISVNSLDIGGKAIQDSIGRVDGTAGNDVSMTSHSEISQTTFVRNAPHHIAEFASTLGTNVSVGDVMGGSPLYSFNFTTFNFTGNRKFIISITLDPIGSFSSASETGFAFAMRATTDSTAYTATSASDYITTRGTSRGGSGLASSVYTLSDIVNLSANTEYYIWVFGNMDDVSIGGSGRGIQNGQISVVGLNR